VRRARFNCRENTHDQTKVRDLLRQESILTKGYYLKLAHNNNYPYINKGQHTLCLTQGPAKVINSDVSDGREWCQLAYCTEESRGKGAYLSFASYSEIDVKIGLVLALALCDLDRTSGLVGPTSSSFGKVIILPKIWPYNLVIVEYSV